jgi:hypothetical protein
VQEAAAAHKPSGATATLLSVDSFLKMFGAYTVMTSMPVPTCHDVNV